MALCIPNFSLCGDSTNCRSYSTVIFTVEEEKKKKKKASLILCCSRTKCIYLSPFCLLNQLEPCLQDTMLKVSVLVWKRELAWAHCRKGMWHLTSNSQRKGFKLRLSSNTYVIWWHVITEKILQVKFPKKTVELTEIFD